MGISHVRGSILDGCIQRMDPTDNQAPTLDWLNIQGQEFLTLFE